MIGVDKNKETEKLDFIENYLKQISQENLINLKKIREIITFFENSFNIKLNLRIEKFIKLYRIVMYIILLIF